MPTETGGWHPQRSRLRYSFVATIEVVDPKSGKQIISRTSNLSAYGCHVGTDMPFPPGTRIKVTIRHRGIMFQSEGRVSHSITGAGIGTLWKHARNISASQTGSGPERPAFGIACKVSKLYPTLRWRLAGATLPTGHSHRRIMEPGAQGCLAQSEPLAKHGDPSRPFGYVCFLTFHERMALTI